MKKQMTIYDYLPASESEYLMRVMSNSIKKDKKNGCKSKTV